MHAKWGVECAQCGSRPLTVQYHSVQKSYDTYEKHIAGMRKHMTGWKSPHMENLLAATQRDSVLISHIYERCAPELFLPSTPQACYGSLACHQQESCAVHLQKLRILTLQPGGVLLCDILSSAIKVGYLDVQRPARQRLLHKGLTPCRDLLIMEEQAIAVCMCPS